MVAARASPGTGGASDVVAEDPAHAGSGKLGDEHAVAAASTLGGGVLVEASVAAASVAAADPELAVAAASMPASTSYCCSL